MNLAKTKRGSYVPAPDYEKTWLSVLWYAERAATFLLGFVMVVGFIVSGFQTLTVKRAELVKPEPVKHIVKHGRKRK